MNIPPDSILRHWYAAFDNSEVWPSWRIATGLACVGGALGRNAWFDYGNLGKIWPNSPVLLVGLSGKGKDTINEPAAEVLTNAGVKRVNGKTMESVYLSLHNIGNPAVGVIFAGELKEFFGAKDYQSGLLEGFTTLFSNNKEVDITTKQDLLAGGKKVIHNPGLTMFAGSTVEWLQKIDGIMDSGFLPRFIVAVELGKGNHFVPNPGRYESIAEKHRIEGAKAIFQSEITALREQYAAKPKVIVDEEEAGYFFYNWYANRTNYFPPTLQAYAQRSGNLMRKIAMLMAISRGHDWIEVQDYEFSSAFVIHGATRLEQAVIPLNPTVACGEEILRCLPATQPQLLRKLSPKFGPLMVKSSILYLGEIGQITLLEDRRTIILLKEGHGPSSSS